MSLPSERPTAGRVLSSHPPAAVASLQARGAINARLNADDSVFCVTCPVRLAIQWFLTMRRRPVRDGLGGACGRWRNKNHRVNSVQLVRGVLEFVAGGAERGPAQCPELSLDHWRPPTRASVILSPSEGSQHLMPGFFVAWGRLRMTRPQFEFLGPKLG